MAVIHFLLAYDLKEQRLVLQREFDDGAEAATAYADLESEHRDNGDLEIVLVGADSLETIKVTHAQYFDELVGHSRYLPA
jgi:hypothetical protein